MLRNGINRFAVLAAVIAGVATSACSGSSGADARDHEGRWLHVPSAMEMVAGDRVLNLRSDGTFSIIDFWVGVDDYGDFHAYRGTYTFAPTTAEDYSAGTLSYQVNDAYDSMSGWLPTMGSAVSDDCTITAGSPKTMSFDGHEWEFIGKQQQIPTTFPP